MGWLLGGSSGLGSSTPLIRSFTRASCSSTSSPCNLSGYSVFRASALFSTKAWTESIETFNQRLVLDEAFPKQFKAQALTCCPLTCYTMVRTARMARTARMTRTSRLTKRQCVTQRLEAPQTPSSTRLVTPAQRRWKHCVKHSAGSLLQSN